LAAALLVKSFYAAPAPQCSAFASVQQFALRPKRGGTCRERIGVFFAFREVSIHLMPIVRAEESTIFRLMRNNAGSSTRSAIILEGCDITALPLLD
jgi:hypothetical protein